MNDTLPQKSPASQYSPGTKTTPSFIQNPQNPPAIYATNVYFTNIPCNPYPFPQPQTWQQPFHPNPYPPQVPPRPYMAPPPMMAPPQHHQPVAYKSSMWSLRQRAATEVFDLLKPDATCFHGIRHFKGHAACPCCASNRCFG
ncbi:hypothetical protein DL95DRAFT_388829 [Leptodontidium sp. 2 PMI_412]|nr:hypothetical protein DL95DRAFT_388829 [Leptodontidium sp. 2 PMI_412]